MQSIQTGRHEQHVQLGAGRTRLDGELVLPAQTGAIVVFAHGSGSSRHSPRNKFVAERLQAAGIGTLLIDLLTAEEESEDRYTGHIRFDIGLLADRLSMIVDWLGSDSQSSSLHIGMFGASTGGGAALVAAAERPDSIEAVVSRGGRPDLAGPALRQVRAPTLLIVGQLDDVVIELNETALRELIACPDKELVIVPGASHLFEEPGTLEQVAGLAAAWFSRHLARS